MTRVIIGDFQGNMIGEIDPDIEYVNWRINQHGIARFNMGLNDPGLVENFVKFGNRILFQFGNGLPDWGGVIDPPRDWRADRVRMTAYSGEYMLGFRHTDRGRYFTKESVGAIFTKLINEANATSPTGVLIGQVWPGGELHSPEYHLKDLYSIFRNSLTHTLSSADWDVRPRIEGDRIVFYVNLYDRMGRDKRTLFSLAEGFNVTYEDLEFVEQGPIVNQWTMAGAGTGWGDDRPMGFDFEAASQNVYGIRSGTRILPDTITPESLDKAAETELKRTAWPTVMIGLSAVDTPPARFSEYGLGDIVKLELLSYGFQSGTRGYTTDVRIVGREYIPGNEIQRLVVEEWSEETT